MFTYLKFYSFIMFKTLLYQLPDFNFTVFVINFYIFLPNIIEIDFDLVIPYFTNSGQNT